MFGVKKMQSAVQDDVYTTLLGKKRLKANMYCYLLVYL